ncbi:hypothetical protein [Limnohabitans sp. JirII-31]|uniref:hypothetical protein n=1 Tax=Limnohabitans sp. JirII-31 TaxID=1977908 RepID=UPI000C1F8A82|nr:hypothetical protein [Limnohabitans sp. JirII-31]
MSFKKPMPCSLLVARWWPGCALLSACLGCALAGSAWAQADALATAPVPATQPSATAKPSVDLRYRSTFDSYQRYVASPVQSWPQANDTVQQVGGWRAYAKELAPTPSAVPSATSTPPPPHVHGGQP